MYAISKSGLIRYSGKLAPLMLAWVVFFIVGMIPAKATEGGRVLRSFQWVSATWNEDQLLLQFDNVQPGTYRLYELNAPYRIVLEIPSLTCSQAASTQEVYNFNNMRLLTQLRANIGPDGARVVLESTYQLHWEITSDPNYNGLLVLCLLKFRQTVEEVAIDQGTKYLARRYVFPSGQRFAHIVISDPATSNLSPRVVLASDVTNRQLASINDIVNSCRASAGVNGGYFVWPGISLSMVIEYGTMRALPQLHRPAFMVLQDRTYLMDYPPITAHVSTSTGLEWDVDVVNQFPGYGKTALLTPGHPARLRNELHNQGQFAVIYKDMIESVNPVEISDLTERSILWSRSPYPPMELLGIGEAVHTKIIINNGSVPIMHAMQGGPFLVRNGQVDVTSAQDDIGPDIANGRTARTAVGFDDDNRIYLVTIEGVNSCRSIGASLNEMAWTMLDLGATWAINLDGGGSTGMALGYTETVTGLPPGGRNIATAVVLIDETGQLQGSEFHF